MTFRGHVEWVESTTPRGFLAGDHILGATSLSIYGADSFVSSTNAGSVVIDGNTYTYSSVMVSIDESITPSTLVVSPGLVQAEISGEPIELVSSDETKFAGVSTGDGIGDVMRVRVPHGLKSYSALTDGIRVAGSQETVDVDRVNGELLVSNVIGVEDEFDASTTPIVTSTAGGERVQIDGNGITLYTNDPVQQLAFTTIGSPFGVAVDSAGNTYVGDFTNRFLRKFTPTGAQVVSGNFPIATTGIPTAVALDSSGNIYVTDQSGPLVRKFSSAGVAGITFSVPASPTGIAVDAAGNIYVSEQTGNNVRKYNSSGTQIVTGGFPISTTGAPKDVTLDAAGNIYVPDVTNNLIRKFSSAGVAGLTFAAAQPVAVRLDSAGYFYVADLNSVTRYTPAGAVDPNQPFPWGGDGRAGDLALDTAGNIYVTDQTNYLIRKYNNPGIVIASGQLISALGRFLAFNATIAGNLEVDSISSANGLQITSPVTALLKMQAKTGVTVASGTGTTTVAVTYDAPFLVAPAVAFTANDAKLTNPIKTVSSTTGFTVQWARSATGTYTFDWIAVVQ